MGLLNILFSVPVPVKVKVIILFDNEEHVV
jgi:hypothetical protein